MARYRSKSSDELAWNDLRRRLTLQVDAEVRGVRERLLDKILSAAWEEFQRSLERGEILHIESNVAAFVAEAIEQSIDVEEIEVANLPDA